MSIRRKRRQRGKLKVLRREALRTWGRLANITKPKSFLQTVIPIVRIRTPNQIATNLVSVQPLQSTKRKNCQHRGKRKRNLTLEKKEVWGKLSTIQQTKSDNSACWHHILKTIHAWPGCQSSTGV